MAVALIAAAFEPACGSVSVKQAMHSPETTRGSHSVLSAVLHQAQDRQRIASAYLRPPDPAALYRMHSTLSGPYRVRNIAVANRALTKSLHSPENRALCKILVADMSVKRG